MLTFVQICVNVLVLNCIFYINKFMFFNKENSMIDETIKTIKQFLDMEDYEFISEEKDEQIQEICVAKLCDILGVEFAYNCQSGMFQIFSIVLSEAISQRLRLGVRFASDELRLVKYNGINFIDKAVELINNPDVDEAVLDIFNFVDEHKKLLINL